MRLNDVALCHVHKAILDKLDIKKLMQEFVLRKVNRRSLFGKHFNLMLIIQNVLLKLIGLMNGNNKKPSKWDLKLTQSDNGRRQPACQVSSPSVRPFCRNSRFCPIRGKNAEMGHFKRKFREERVNRRQLRLVLWVKEGWGYHAEETRRRYLFWFEHSPRVSQTDRESCL